MEKIAPGSPVFALVAAVYKIDDYLRHDLPDLSRIKCNFWGHDNIIFHSRQIRKRLGPFSILTDKATDVIFCATLADFFQHKSKACLIAAAIDKARHKQQYTTPAHPYELALQFILERAHMHVSSRCIDCGPTVFVFESRGHTEDAELKKWFERICAGANYRNEVFNFEAVFADKRTNAAGLQVADLAAYPITHFVRNEQTTRPDWAAVSHRMRRGYGGKLKGWGLKIFP